MNDDDGPRLTPGQAKKAAREFLELDKHKPKRDHTGRDPRDERTRTGDLEDPALQEPDE